LTEILAIKVVVNSHTPWALCRYEVATRTTSKKLVSVGCDVPRAMEAILSVLPVDYFVPTPAVHMAPSDGATLPPAGVEVIAAAEDVLRQQTGDADLSAAPCERFAFYDEARTCFAVVQTTERRPYGNVILTKGVVGPDGKDLKP